MGESAELTQQSHIVSFSKLDKRETAPAASHWHRAGAKPKQHTKVNQQAHSTPLKLTLPLKNRFLPLQESTNAPATPPPSPEMRPDGQCGQRRKNQSPRRPLQESTNATHAPLSPEMRPDGQCGQRRKNQSPRRPLQESTKATHAPLSPEMRPDGQCGQRRKNQSPRRRAVHVSATVQQGPISEKADEPDTLIIGDSTIKDISGKKIKTCIFSHGMATILPWSDAHATIRAQAGKKRDYSPPHTSTLPLSDTQIANSTQTLNSPPDAIDSPPDAIAQVEKKTLKRDNSPSDAINTVPSPIADASYLSSPNVSSLCDFPAEYKRLEYVGSQFISGSLIASPCRGDRLITPKRMAPQPHHHTDISDEYF
ncbi:unnamed protein product [Boreogadus saida]